MNVSIKRKCGKANRDGGTQNRSDKQKQSNKEQEEK